MQNCTMCKYLRPDRQIECFYCDCPSDDGLTIAAFNANFNGVKHMREENNCMFYEVYDSFTIEQLEDLTDDSGS